MIPDYPTGGEPNEMPEKLKDALRRLDRHRVLVPTSVDKIILDVAREHISRIEPRRHRHGLAWWTAIAASFFLLAWLTWSVFRTEPGLPVSGPKTDRNGDGVIDILDALALAYQVQDSDARFEDMDLNRDGVADERDADVIVNQVVQLKISNPS